MAVVPVERDTIQDNRSEASAARYKMRFVYDPFADITINRNRVYRDPKNNAYILPCNTGADLEHEGIIILYKDAVAGDSVSVILPSATAYDHEFGSHLTARYVKLDLYPNGQTGLNYNFRMDHEGTDFFDRPTILFPEEQEAGFQATIDREMVERYGTSQINKGFQQETADVMQAIASLAALPSSFESAFLNRNGEPQTNAALQAIVAQRPDGAFLYDQLEEASGDEVTAKRKSKEELLERSVTEISRNVAEAIAVNRRNLVERFLPSEDTNIGPLGFSLTHNGVQAAFGFYHPDTGANSVAVSAIVDHPTNESNQAQPEIPTITFNLMNTDFEEMMISVGTDGRTYTSFKGDQKPPHSVEPYETWIYDMAARLTRGLSMSFNQFEAGTKATRSLITERLQKAADAPANKTDSYRKYILDQEFLPEGWTPKTVQTIKVLSKSTEAAFAIYGTDRTAAHVTAKYTGDNNLELAIVKHSLQGKPIHLERFRVNDSGTIQVAYRYQKRKHTWEDAWLKPSDYQLSLVKRLIADGLIPALTQRAGEIERSRAVLKQIRSMITPPNARELVEDLMQQMAHTASDVDVPASLALIPVSPSDEPGEIDPQWQRDVAGLRRIRREMSDTAARLKEQRITGLHQLWQLYNGQQTEQTA